jgi:hypothetical protein
MSASDAPTWESVLAQCEATASQAEELLRSRSRFDAERFAALTAVDLWQLDLGPLPSDLHDRARAVHRRQLSLQTELISAMTGIQHQIEMTSSSAQARQGSQFLDRTV